MDSEQVYTRLARWLKTPDAPSFNRVLEMLLVPADAALIPELSEPLSGDEIAARFNLDPGLLRPRLEALIQRGWLRKDARGYYAPPANARFMPHNTLPGVSPEQKREAWNRFFYQDYGRVLIDAREHTLETKGHNQWRFAPAGKALEMSPNILPQYILRSEDVRDMVRRATDITTHVCGCRDQRQNCSRPKDNCLRVVWSGKILDNQPGGHVGEVHISAERAIEIMDESEDAGLCHTLLNAGILEDSITICHCCPCCCYLLYPVVQAGKAHKLITPSRYRVVIETEKCEGCQTCVERCAFEALEMRKVAGSKKLKAFVINDNCLGCGVCMLKCPNGAMHLEIVRPPSHIPLRPMSQASSMPPRFKEA
jgi:NAD-dependent dihydropyrimidine dehydrogenase PreA subunit